MLVTFGLCVNLPAALMAQNTPGVVLKSNQFGTSLEPTDIHPNPTVLNPNKVNEEWIFSIVEDKYTDLINAGFIEPKIDDGSIPQKFVATHKFPALVKLDKDLNLKNEAIFKEVFDPVTSTTHNIEGKINTFTEVSEIPRHGYVACGHVDIFVGSVIVTKASFYRCGYDLTSSTEPFVIDAASTTRSRFFAIRGYFNTTSNAFEYVAAGYKEVNEKKKLWVVKLDQNGCIISETFLTDDNSNDFFGELRGVSFVFKNGSLPSGQPKVIDDQPDYIMVSGTVFQYEDMNNASNDNLDEKDAFVVCLEIDLVRKGYMLFDSDPSAPVGSRWHKYPTTGFFDYGQFPRAQWVCEPQTNPDLTTFSGHPNYFPDPINPSYNHNTFADVGYNIEQNMEGGLFLFSSLSHHTFIDKDDLGSCNENQRSELISGDHIIHLLSYDFIITHEFTVEKDLHTSHFSGDDIFWRSKFNYDNTIYTLGTTGDFNKALKLDPLPPPPADKQDFDDNFMLVATNWSSAGSTITLTKKWHKVFIGGSGITSDQSGKSCGFDCAITSNNEIIATGNNHVDYDNWDWVKISDDCVLNSTLPVADIMPNQPKNIFSVHAALPPGQTTLTWGQNHVVGAQVVIESGFTLKIPVHLNNQIQFYDVRLLADEFEKNNSYGSDAGIVIQGGGKLEMLNAAELTSVQNSGCFTSWGGVDIGPRNSSPFVQAEIDMENSTISNARTGITVNSGIIKAHNHTPFNQSPITNLDYTQVTNFVNNKTAIEYKFGNQYIDGNQFYCQNFLCSDRTSHQKGMDYFVKYRGNFDVNNINSQIRFEGCDFSNTYFDKLGFCTGVSAFGGSVDFMFADIDPATPPPLGSCLPINRRKCHFEGLYSAVRNGNPGIDNRIRMRVLEADFVNNKENIYEAIAENSYIYKNNIWWNSTYPSVLNLDKKLGIWSSWGYTTKVFENVLSNDHDLDFIGILNAQNAWFTSPGDHNVAGNSITNLTTAPLGTGQWLADDNSFLQVSCNIYDNLALDWYVLGQLQDQGDGNFSNNNFWSNCFNGTNNIQSVASFDYYHSVLNNPEFCSTKPPVTFYQAPDKSCATLNSCAIYSVNSNEGENNWDILAMRPPSMNDQILRDLFNGNMAGVRQNRASIELNSGFENLDILVDLLTPPFEQHRSYQLNEHEINTLEQLAQVKNFTGNLAEGVLFFFADKRLDRSYDFNQEAPSSVINSLAAVHPTISQLNIYPNPAKDELFIVFPNATDYDISIFDLTGKVCLHEENRTMGKALDISSLSPGIYTLHLIIKNQVYSRKLLIQP